MKKLLFTVLLIGLASCGSERAADLPPPGEIANSLNLVLADTGFFTDAAVSRVIGKHYLPGGDRWQIIACFRFTDAAANNIQECNDSFMLFQLDNGRWVVSVNRNGVYRWREVVRPSLEAVDTTLESEPNTS